MIALREQKKIRLSPAVAVQFRFYRATELIPMSDLSRNSNSTGGHVPTLSENTPEPNDNGADASSSSSSSSSVSTFSIPSGVLTDTSFLSATAHACAWHVIHSNNTLRYRILGTVPDHSTLVGHTRNFCHFAYSVSSDTPRGMICTDSLPEGILHLLLIDSTDYPLSERLVYIRRPDKRLKFSVRSDRLHYGKREKVRLALTFDSSDSRVPRDSAISVVSTASSTSCPSLRNCSVSITDAHSVRFDSLGKTIGSYLLLSSDLKGYVHNVGYYFLVDAPQRQHHQDLVMLTHGWRKYGTKSLFRPEPFSPKHYIEHGRFFTGRVISAWGKPVRDAKVSVVSINKENIFGSATTDSQGRFTMEGLDYQDTTILLFTSRGGKRNKIPYKARSMLTSIFILVRSIRRFIRFYPRTGSLRERPNLKLTLRRYLPVRERTVFSNMISNPLPLQGRILSVLHPRNRWTEKFTIRPTSRIVSPGR